MANMPVMFSKIFEPVKKMLEEGGASEADIVKLQEGVVAEIEKVKPPTIAIIGFCGVGKSSTLNALFNAGCATSDVGACTQREERVQGRLEKYIGLKGDVFFYDMPGLGESIKKDPKHYATYERVLPKADVIIWLFHAGDRSMTPMQNALQKLTQRIGTEFTRKLVFAINKADAIAPGENDWNEKFNVPSQKQKENLAEFERYVLERVREVLPRWNGPIVSYSAKRRYRLEQLMTKLVEAMPRDRIWTLEQLAAVADYEETIPSEYRELIRSMIKDTR